MTLHYHEELLILEAFSIHRHWWRSDRHWWGSAVTGTGGAVCKGATPSVEQ
jgi:hypothetical protein